MIIDVLTALGVVVAVGLLFGILLALVISLALASIKKLRNLFQTIYFLPYVTNTLAVGMVFLIERGDDLVMGIFL